MPSWTQIPQRRVRVEVPASFQYERATSVDDTLALLERLGPSARIIAGGHSLLPMMKLRFATPSAVVDINDLHELDYIREEGDELRIGSLVRHRELLESEMLCERFAIFADAERVIADPLVRNRGTVGGSLCLGDPLEDLSTVCTALESKVVIRSQAGERVVELRDFYKGPYETDAGPADLLLEVRIPLQASGGSAYEKVKRRTGDYAIAAAGVAVSMADGQIASGGIGLCGVGPGVVNPQTAEEALAGQIPSEQLFGEVARLCAQECEPSGDERGSAEYKRHLITELTKRALRRAVARAL